MPSASGDTRTRQSKRAVLALAACLAVLLSACSRYPDAGNGSVPEQSVPATPSAVSGPAIRGSVTDASGHVGGGSAGAAVTVSVVLHPSEQAWRDAKAFFSFGFGCLDKQGCTAPKSHTVVAADGHFAIAVPHGMTDKDGLAVTVEATRGSDARVATTLLLPASATAGADVSVPLAAQAPSLQLSGHHAVFQPPKVTGAAASGGTVELDQIDTKDDQPVSAGPQTDVSKGFDIRALEDGRGMLVSHQTGTVNGLPAQYSASLVVTGHAVPPSRGAACSVEDSHGAALPQNPCGLTNGALDQTWWTPQDDPACSNGPCGGTFQNDHRDVTVTLPKPIPAELLLVRGCGFTCKVQVSADGKTFGAFSQPPDGSNSPDNEFVLTLPGRPVAAVRVETAPGGFFGALRQVSVF